jgi:hypothetical protein
MRKLSWIALVLVGAVGAVNVVAACGSDTTVDATDDAGNEGSTNPPNPNPPPNGDGSADAFLDAITDGGRSNDAFACVPTGTTCASSAECCTANCSVPDGGGAKVCGSPVGSCTPTGNACPADPTQCCQGACLGGLCGKCVDNNGACGSSADCCGGGSCVPDGKGGGICQAINCTPAPCTPGCKTAGNSCAANAECCGGFCNGGVCSGAAGPCTQTGDVCFNDAQCCGGPCIKAVGATLGTCKAVTVSTTGGPCKPAGTLCDPNGTCTGADCCSRSCAPFPFSGLGVCQSESGCRMIGDLCRHTGDCCGVKDEPGSIKANGGGQSTDVQCIKTAPTDTYGKCDYVQTVCSPAGALCKPGKETDGGAMSCSTKIDCCAGNANQNPTCQIDSNGIPRCTIAGDLDCTAGKPPPGTACASTADCCGDPCIPNPAGGSPAFICGDACQPSGTVCTSNADCCPGLPCVIPPGATTGVCNGTVLPDGGVSDAAPPDAGNLPDGGSCTLYGQTCAQSSECCSNVPCVNGTCHFP